MTPKQIAIIDAAIDVATFSKKNSYPQEGTQPFVEFTEMLDKLATTINAEYPSFNHNIWASKTANYEV